MKDPEQLIADAQSRLKRTWAEVLAGTDSTSWPHDFPLGQPDSKQLSATFDSVVDAVDRWRSWGAAHDIALTWRSRRVNGTPQELPTHVAIPDVDTAARLCGQDWPQRLTTARKRLAVLQAQYSHVADDGRLLRAVEALSDLDFTLLCRASDWFAHNDATGLTPRQVPIEGMHAKWLNTRQTLVRELAGVDDLKLLPPHPAWIHFTYLDPAYRATGGRVHDSATVGDSAALPYQPRVVVISENKDTAIHMPPVAGGISVEGVGKGGGTAAAFSWVTEAEHVLYWGDMDADGFEILNGFRAAGVPARSLLMDMQTYVTWERYGTNHDPKGQPIKATGPKVLPHLTDRERELYDCLAAESWTRYRRIEQERIPLAEAHRLLLWATGEPPR